jgi:C4-dicarboxylate transporter, DctM subunit
VLLAGWSIWCNRHNRTPLGDFSGRDLLAALRETVWELPLPVVVLGGIYSGFFAVSEAAAVTALYVLIVEVVVLREVSPRQLPVIMRQSMILVGGILIILGVSLASTNYMIDAGVPEMLFDFLQAHVSSKFTFLVLLTMFLLALGAVLDIFSALVLVVPLVLPVAVNYGIHPVHLGIIFLANMQIGYLTPPVGLNLFIASYRFNKPIMEIYRATFPFLLILLAAVLLITFWPGLSMWLLR